MAQKPLPPWLDEELFGGADRARREPDRVWWILPVYVVLFGLSVPWYLPASSTPAVWMGLPYWVVVSLAAALAVAVFTLFVVRNFWSVEQPPLNPHLPEEAPETHESPEPEAPDTGPPATAAAEDEA